MAKSSFTQVFGICIFIFAITWIVFGQTIHDEFVNFDDDTYVYENGIVQQGLTKEGVVAAFTHAQAFNWHPVTTISHMLDCQLFGLGAGKHHLTNVLLQSVTAVLLFLVLREMTGAMWPSAFVAAVFAIHPLRVESVAWVSERKDVLSGLFFMLTLGAYVRYAREARSPGRYLLVLILFALGLMAKPMLVTVPFILLLLDYWPLKRFPATARAGFSIPRQLVLEKIPLLLMSAAVGVVVYLVQEKARQSAETITFPMRIGNALMAYVTYAGELFYPVKLAVLYPFPAAGYPAYEIAGAGLLLVGISAAVFRWREKRPYLVVGWLWYVVMLLPVIGIIQVGAQARADRYTYLPEIGLCLALAWAAREWTLKRPEQQAALGAAGAVIVLVLIPISRAQAAFWHDSEKLWEHALACTTNNAVAEGNLANQFFKQAQFDEAIEHANRAIEIDPKFAAAHNCLGYALFQKGQTDGAIGHFQEALKIRPDFAEAHNNLGMVLWRTGKLGEAIDEFETAIKIQPELFNAQNNLGAALVQKGEPEAAIAHYEVAIKLSPDFVGAENNYAWVLASCTNAAVRNGTKAVELARRANQTADSKNMIVLRTLAAAYAEAGRFSEAIDSALQALQLAKAQNSTTWINAIQAEIGLYQNKQPFRADGKTP